MRTMVKSLGKVEKAKIADVVQIHRLVNYWAEKGEMLPRALSEIYESLRDYSVLREDGEVAACIALHISWLDLAEVRSLAVAEGKQRQDAGSRLVKACIREAARLEIPTVFCLTYKPGFFQKMGFRVVEKAELPRKIWTDCYHCAKFPDCDESAMTIDLAKK